MNQVKHYLNTDYFKIGRYGDKHVKYVNIGLLGKVIVDLYF
jgi:hypothetical protein